MRIGGFGAVKRAVQINIDHCPPGVEGHVGKGHHEIARRVGDHDVQAAKSLHRHRHRSLDRFRLPHIGGNRNGLPACATKSFGRRLQPIKFAAGQHDAGSGPHQRRSDGKADAAAPARHQCRPPRQRVGGKERARRFHRHTPKAS